MFTLAKERSYFWPVKIKVPIDGGQFADASFDCKFKLLDQARLVEVAMSGIGDDAFLREVMVDWKGVQDEQGRELPFSETARDAMIGIPYARDAIVLAYNEAISGSRRKN